MNAVSSTGYIALNDKMVNEQWIGRDTEGSVRDLIWGIMLAFA
jgi:hypothetical protein